MTPVSPKIFVPTADSGAVQKLLDALGTDRTAVIVRVVLASRAMEGCCYQNVRDKVRRVGGRMQPGWAVWQHSNLFIEAEPHVVFDPGNAKQWIDCTPNFFPDRSRCREILFVPSDNATQDFTTTDVPDNVRVPLVDDPHLSEALKLCSEKTALVNRIPRDRHPSGKLTYHYPPDKLMQITQLEKRIATLLSAAMQALRT